MFKSYLKSAWRNLVNGRTFTLINIIGLSMGMAACMLILQYVSFELSFDRFNKNADDLYRVVNDRYHDGKLLQHGTITYSAIGPALKHDYPEVVENTRVEPFANQVITEGDKRIGGQAALAVENSFLTMFSYTIVAGDATGGLKRPNSVILTETLARKLFDIRNSDFQSVLGKTLVISRDSMPYMITAVCKDVPENSHLSFDLLVSYNTLYSGGNGTWKQADYDFQDSDFWQYILLKHGTDYKELDAKLAAFSQKYFQGSKVSGSVEKFSLQPLTRAHLYSDFEYEIGKTGNATVVWGLLVIAMLIIIIAWVNYINLSTAKSLERAKEVGIRKVTGATRIQLIQQFLTESVLINLFSLAVSIIMVLMVQGSFNSLIHHKLSLNYLFDKGLGGYWIPLALAGIFAAGILFSGFYPAFVLSAFKPVTVLKGKFTASFRGILLRKVLVVGQFAITVILIFGSVVVYRQIKFVHNVNLGMNLSQILVVQPPLLTRWDSSFINRENTFKNELDQLPHVKGASVIGRTAGDELSRLFNVHRADIHTDARLSMRNMSVDGDFIHVFGIKLLAGRDFDHPDFNANWDKLHNVMINESAVKLLGYHSNQDALSKNIDFFGRNWSIVGVIHDFHQKSLHYPVEPTVLIPSYGTDNPICIKVDSKDVASTIKDVRTRYDTFFPGNYFDYYFLDEKFNKLYRDDQLFGSVFGIFAGFAILIASLGLLGLSLFATVQRTKEIGVRKVLGASVTQIVYLLSKDFIRLVVLAFGIASPVAWWLMRGWLQGFAYRIEIPWWVFGLAGGVSVSIALATISFQAMKAAISSPVKALRSD